MLPALLLIIPAHADRVEGGVQAAVFPPGLAFAERQLRGRDFHLEMDDLGGGVECYDQVGIRDFNLDIPIDTVDLDMDDGVLWLTVDFGTIRGDDMVLYGEDADYLDACAEFEVDLIYAQLTGGRLVIGLDPTVSAGRLDLGVGGDPVRTGDLETDIDWFPDDLVLSFVEDMVLEAIAGMLGDELPPLAESYVGEPMFGDAYGEFLVDLGLDEAIMSSRGLKLRASSDVEWGGPDGCPSDDRGPGEAGSSPTLEFVEALDSAVAVAVTEGMINEMFLAAWRDGYFCFTEENVSEFIDLVASSFDPSVAGLAGTANLGEPPRVTVDAAGVQLSLRGVSVAVTGAYGGDQEDLLEIGADVTGTFAVGVDQELSSFTLSVRALEVNIYSLHAEHLLSNDASAEAELIRFIEDFVAGWGASQADDMVLFSSLYHLFGTVLRIDDLDYGEGAVSVYASIFEEDDPEVDLAPPDTEFELLTATGDSVTLVFAGSDDRPGALAYSYQVDDGGWSGWSAESVAQLTGLPPGVYQIEVIARDSWLNVDPEPAVGWLEVTGEEVTTTGCACAHRRSRAPGWGWLGLLGLAALRREAG